MANEEVFYSALHWAKKAEASAKLASELAQSGGKLIQLGFDGTMKDGVLVFKHAPGGIDTPYQLVDDVEYEIDLAYNETGDLPNLTEIAVQNGGETIRFISALHRDAMTNATVADMDAVMRHDATTGYRWLFKATFKIAPNGAKVFLLYPVVAAKDYSDKTNCITEIPQDIKLELNNGTLTLKAGSRVYVPNGAGKFDEVEITKDLSTAFDNNNQKMVFVTPAKNAIHHCNVVNQQSSGASSTSTSSYNFWYDTTNNYVKFTNNSGSTWTSGYSLPICLVTKDSGIDQVFNGFGYIGSTVFALPGVKGLIPDGRNADGSLKNIEIVLDGVKILGNPDTNNALQYLMLESNGAFTRGSWYYEQTQAPSWVSNNNNIWYNPETNKMYYYRSSTNQYYRNFIFTGLTFRGSNGSTTISEFNQAKLPFHAVDRNDSSWIAAQAMPSGKYISLTPGASETSYTAPANGYFTFSIKSSSANIAYATAAILSSDSGVVLLRSHIWIPSNASGNTTRGFLPCKKGQRLFLGYYNATVDLLQFVYAEGEK